MAQGAAAWAGGTRAHRVPRQGVPFPAGSRLGREVAVPPSTRAPPRPAPATACRIQRRRAAIVHDLV